ncbi:hypothetical protein ACFSKY_11600 [Azotobacter chroococcum]|uniref:hypothetical protein n=1 Tax=Azotobacter chroococcum TaxID=353 RepID=UPI0010D9966F|nr:hypothetical protein E0E53_17145 [Azotobacter chroococcum]
MLKRFMSMIFSYLPRVLDQWAMGWVSEDFLKKASRSGEIRPFRQGNGQSGGRLRGRRDLAMGRMNLEGAF